MIAPPIRGITTHASSWPGPWSIEPTASAGPRPMTSTEMGVRNSVTLRPPRFDPTWADLTDTARRRSQLLIRNKTSTTAARCVHQLRAFSTDSHTFCRLLWRHPDRLASHERAASNTADGPCEVLAPARARTEAACGVVKRAYLSSDQFPISRGLRMRVVRKLPIGLMASCVQSRNREFDRMSWRN